MEESTSKEKIMKRVRNALIQKGANPFPDVEMDAPVFNELTDALDITFAEEFTRLGGKFVYCESESEIYSTLSLLSKANTFAPIFCRDESLLYMLQQYGISATNDENKLNTTKVAITGCEFLVARLGSVVVSSKQLSGRKLNISPDIHIVLASASQLVPDIKQALSGVREKYGKAFPSMVSVISGPSRTADIEKTLVMGAHGPKELYVFLYDDSNS